MRKSLSVILSVICILNMFVVPTYANLKDDVINAKNGTTSETTPKRDTTNQTSTKKTIDTSKIDVSKIQNQFTDIEKGSWYYDNVLTAYSLGLMQGVGNNLFDPQKTMTVAEFLTVSVNALYKNEVNNTNKGSNWWDVYYTIALTHDLITSNEYSRKAEDMNKSITRQEMARIASRVSLAQGEAKQTVSNTSIIPDYDTIPTSYRSFVQDCYAKGILNGDQNGRFNGGNSLTRAEATTAILNLIDESRRKPNTGNTFTTIEKHEWVEGERHEGFLPQVGDVIVKADGTRVVLEETIVTLANGKTQSILGVNQGVDIYAGLYINGVKVESGMEVLIIGGTPLAKDPITGECRTLFQWSLVESLLNPNGSYIGDYEGEVFNNWFKWTEKGPGGVGYWYWIGPM